MSVSKLALLLFFIELCNYQILNLKINDISLKPILLLIISQLKKLMETLIEFIKILAPAAFVLYGMFLVTKTFLNKDFEKKIIELKVKHFDTTIQIRLQAYERMALFLERITPTNLIPRVNENGYIVAQLHAILLNEIRQEFNYNLSQQIYLSDETWQKIRNSTELVTSLINDAASELSPEAPSIELVKKVFELVITSGNTVTNDALLALKTEAQYLFA